MNCLISDLSAVDWLLDQAFEFFKVDLMLGDSFFEQFIMPPPLSGSNSDAHCCSSGSVESLRHQSKSENKGSFLEKIKKYWNDEPLRIIACVRKECPSALEDFCNKNPSILEWLTNPLWEAIKSSPDLLLPMCVPFPKEISGELKIEHESELFSVLFKQHLDELIELLLKTNPDWMVKYVKERYARAKMWAEEQGRKY